MKSIITGRRTPVRAAVLGASLLAAAALPAQAATAHATPEEGVVLKYDKPKLEDDKVTWGWSVHNKGEKDVDEVVLTHKLTLKEKNGSTTQLTVSTMSDPCSASTESGAEPATESAAEPAAEPVTCKYGKLRAGEEKSGELVAELREKTTGTVEINGQVSWEQAEPVSAEDVPAEQAAPESEQAPSSTVAP